ncbi:SPFH domain-containing protein [Sodalis sp. dw_96]|uniref:SPFH domain-containing protein n=1 Tax=Sodalis sp. dw_96 TaxID=2719794 RepID=UPI0021054E8F|nr:SPFH domain-containing protein [Sodalis sp. dw_96]
MRVDLDDDTADIKALPRFQRAAFQARGLYRFAQGLGALSAILLLAALLIHWIAPGSIWLPLVCNNIAALLVLTAALLSARQVAAWRAAALTDITFSPAATLAAGTPSSTIHSAPLPTGTTLLPAPSGASAAETSSSITAPGPLAAETPASAAASELPPSPGRIALFLSAQLRRIGSDPLWLMGLSLLALLLVRGGWNVDARIGLVDQTVYVVVGLLILAAFGLLVLERHLAAGSSEQWPEAAGLIPLVRMVIAVQLLCVPCLLFAAVASPWPGYLASLTGLLPALVALELMVRGALSLFNPRRERREPRLIGESMLAAQLRWPPRPLQFFQHELQQRFGIDLRQIWAFTFMRKASLPILALLLLTGWLLTGVTEVAFNGRGIYERFGKPVKVIAPGLNIGLPWPFGRVLPVENGVVHEITTGSADTAAGSAPAPAEGPAPDSANRLWDAYHPSERSQVIAGVAGDKQSFQIVNMDVRFIYRIGLSNKAALAATYNTADVPALIRSTANRVLVDDFASRTLDDVLGHQRADLAAEIGKVVQGRLDQMNSGVEILAIVIEAIHPPAGAANAYHGVQAAQIAAQALIARERGEAAARLNAAQLEASLAADQAAAAAHENLAQAQSASLRFGAERQAWQNAGQAFLTETYFSQLARALGNTPALILDHRIGAGEPPTLDLRSFVAPIDPGVTKAKPQ